MAVVSCNLKFSSPLCQRVVSNQSYSVNILTWWQFEPTKGHSVSMRAYPLLSKV